MLSAIEAAKESVRLEMYIYTASRIGERFRDALTKAAERGVRVRVLIDALGSLTLSGSFWDPLLRAGGEFRWFNPLHLRRLAIRNHRKLLACDDRIAFIGGFNIAPEYEGDGVTKGWYDLGIQFSGVLVRELAASFDALFALADFEHRRFIRLRRPRFSNLVSTQDGQLLLTAPGRGRKFLQRTLLHDLSHPREVKIISAYFLPTRPIRRALFRAVRQGGRVQLIMAGKSDVPLAQLASRHLYQAFFRAGVEVFEYEPQILHAKLLVIDEVVYVGSANLDRRSLFINYELLLRLPNTPLASEAAEIFDAALARCRRIDPNEWRRARSFWSKLKERCAYWLLGRVDPYVARRQMQRLESMK
ncbi:MAG: phospholipase D-like domain-containing protein [Verrucomicrobiales bacterium]|nr:phospholipase D-like domain-containing protein [Verrucomicrobiales bacterium]